MAFPTAKIFADPFGSFLRGMRQGLEDNRRDFESWLKYQNLLLNYARTLAALSGGTRGGAAAGGGDDIDPTAVLNEFSAALDSDDTSSSATDTATDAADTGANNTDDGGDDTTTTDTQQTETQPTDTNPESEQAPAAAPTETGSVTSNNMLAVNDDPLKQAIAEAVAKNPKVGVTYAAKQEGNGTFVNPPERFRTTQATPPAVAANGKIQDRILPTQVASAEPLTLLAQQPAGMQVRDLPDNLPKVTDLTSPVAIDRIQDAYDKFGITTMLQQNRSRAAEARPPASPPIPNPLVSAIERQDKVLSGEYKLPELPPTAPGYSASKQRKPAQTVDVTPQEVRDNILMSLRAKTALVRNSKLPPDVKYNYIQRADRILSSPAPTSQLVPIAKALERELDNLLQVSPPRRKKYYDRIPVTKSRKKYYDRIVD